MNLSQVQSRRPSLTRAALLALTAGLSLGASVVHAQIVDSGPVNIPVPDNIDGVYLNVLTGVAGTSGTAVPGWDVNPYSGAPGGFFLFAPTTGGYFNPQGVVSGNYLLPLGTIVQGPNTAFFNPAGANPQTANVTLNSSNNYVGFRFLNESGGTNHFGYMQLQFGATAGTRTIVRYWFNATPNTPITVAAPPPPATPPVFGYTPTAGSTVTGTGGELVGSTSSFTITPSIATAGTGTGAAATTTLTCTAPTAPFSGFAQTVTAVGTGAISGGPLAGACTRGTSPATATLTCSENQGGTAVARTWTLNCPAGSIPSVPVNATSTWSLIALMLALFGFAAVAVRRQG